MNYLEDNFAETFTGIDFFGEEMVGVEFDACTFYQCNFAHVVCKRTIFREVYFHECDLSLISVLDCQFIGCRFEGCKIIGVDWSRADWSGLTQSASHFQHCILNDSSFWGVKMEAIMIKACEAKGVDFREAYLVDGDFSQSDFSGALFRNTHLERANFSHAINFDIDIRINSVKEAKFSRYEATRLLQGLDIILVD